MSKSPDKKSKKDRKKIKKNVVPQPSQPIATSSNTTASLPTSKKKSFPKIIVGALTIISIIIGIIIAVPQLREMFFPDSVSEKYEKETFVKGELNTPVLNPTTFDFDPEISRFSNSYFQAPITIDSVGLPPIKGLYIKDFEKLLGYRGVILLVGTHAVMLMNGSILYKGPNILKRLRDVCVLNDLYLLVRNDSLYVSAEFKDLEKEEVIGSIQYNKWKLYKPNLFTFYNDANRLEVQDKQGNIAFSLSFKVHDKSLIAIEVAGYFIDSKSIYVAMNDTSITKSLKIKYPNENIDCISKQNTNWKSIALERIETIKPMVK